MALKKEQAIPATPAPRNEDSGVRRMPEKESARAKERGFRAGDIAERLAEIDELSSKRPPKIGETVWEDLKAAWDMERSVLKSELNELEAYDKPQSETEKPSRPVSARDKFKKFQQEDKVQADKKVKSWKDLGDKIEQTKRDAWKSESDKQSKTYYLKSESEELALMLKSRPRGVSDEQWQDFLDSSDKRQKTIERELESLKKSNPIKESEVGVKSLQKTRTELEDTDEIKEAKIREKMKDDSDRKAEREKRRREFGEWTKLNQKMKEVILTDLESERRLLGFLPRFRAIHPGKFDRGYSGDMPLNDRTRFDALSSRLFPASSQRFQGSIQGLDRVRKKGVIPDREIFEYVVEAYRNYLEPKKWEDVQQ